MKGFVYKRKERTPRTPCSICIMSVTLMMLTVGVWGEIIANASAQSKTLIPTHPINLLWPRTLSGSLREREACQSRIKI